MTEAELIAAHDLSKNQKEQLATSTVAGCFYCCKIIDPFDDSMILKWTHKKNSALCPHCGIDSILGNAAIPITPELLKDMYTKWFHYEPPSRRQQ